MARKRAYKKRVDYRKGGRVSYQIGGMTDEDRQEALGAINPVAPSPTPTAAPSNVPTKSFGRFAENRFDETLEKIKKNRWNRSFSVQNWFFRLWSSKNGPRTLRLCRVSGRGCQCRFLISQVRF